MLKSKIILPKSTQKPILSHTAPILLRKIKICTFADGSECPFR